MIVKVKSHKQKSSFKKLLDYMLSDKNRLIDENNESFIITHNLWGDTIKEWTEQYRENETYRQRKQKNQVFLSHEILSWHRDEKNLSLEKMEDMAREYIQLRNPNALYVATPHMDKNHRHVHFSVSAIEYRTGKSMRMTKKDFGELKKSIQNYQKEKYPELSKSVVEHSKRVKSITISDTEQQIKNRTGRETKKEELSKIINECLSKANTMDEYIKILKENNLRPYERNGRFTGVWYENAKYRFARLPINIEKVVALNKTVERQKQIQIMRGGGKNKSRGVSR